MFIGGHRFFGGHLIVYWCSQALLAAYALCGTDIVEAMKGITHNTALRVLSELCGKEHPSAADTDLLLALIAFGTETTIMDGDVVVLERFVCLLYKSKEDNLNTARTGCWSKKSHNPDTLMCTSHTFVFHCKRSFYQVRVVLCEASACRLSICATCDTWGTLLGV